MSDPEFGEWLANDLVANLDHMLAESPVKAVKGQKTVEVKSLWANKGEVYSRLLQSGATPEFIMAAGDDVTDEDLFARVPQGAWTIHVGRNQSKAKFYLSDSGEMVSLLSDIAGSRQQSAAEPPEILSLNTRVPFAKVVNGCAS
jgi:trehalose 6-phosphate synthase/phosphatase